MLMNPLAALAVDDLPAILPRPGRDCQIRSEALRYPRKGNKAKMRIFIVLTGCFILAATATPSPAITLASRGTTDVVIVMPRKPSLSVARAAGELQVFLGQITGAEFQCVTEATTAARHEIVLGAPERLRQLGVTVDLGKLGPEGYVLRTVDGHLVIAGSDVRGVMYGVYGLLQDHLGCRWFTPDVSLIPEHPTLESPLRWTCKSTRRLAEELTRQNHPVSVARTGRNGHPAARISLAGRARLLRSRLVRT